MKRSWILLLGTLLIILSATPAMALTSLYDWNFYVDGTTYEYQSGDDMPTTGMLDDQGLGTLSWSTSVAGSHTFIAMFDYEIDEDANGFTNEIGEVHGTPQAGQSWEIDDPLNGNIYFDVVDGKLTNTNALSSPRDVSFALGWNFTLKNGESATIDLVLSQLLPASGFSLQQFDPESDVSVFYSGNLTIQGGGSPTPVPEPATMFLMATGLIGLGVAGRKRLRPKRR